MKTSPAPADARSMLRTFTRADWSLILLVFALQLGLCFVRSRGRLYWADELLGVKVLNDPSFSHMFVGWRNGADGGGGLYYLLGRLWLDVVGSSELTLRLFSTIGVMLSVFWLWLCGRNYYETSAMAFGVGAVYFTAPPLLWQTVNGRFYGMLLGSVALASVAYFKTAEKDSLSWQDLLLVAVSNALVCSSHILGMVYSAVLLLAMVALDRARGRWRPGLYLSGLAGWIVLPFCYRAIINSTSVASTSFWTQKPTVVDLAFGLFAFGIVVVAATLLVVVCLAIQFWRRKPTAHGDGGGVSRLPVYIFAAAMFLAELIMFAKSRLPGISIFSDRYLLPLGLATVLMLAELITRAFQGELLRERHNAGRALLASCLVLGTCAAFGFSRHPHAELYPKAGLAQRIAEQLPPDRTVVVTALPLFVFLKQYEPTHHYIFLLDWQYDLSAARAKGDHSGEHLMENWKRAGYESDSILPCDQILAQEPSFSVLSFAGKSDWVADRLAAPSYETQRLTDFKEWFPFTVWRARRVGKVPACR